MQYKLSSESIFYIVASVSALLFAIICSFSPLEADDYWFLEGTQGMSHGWEMFLTACETMKERWVTDTGRLGNIINPIFLALLPKWFFNITSGIAVFIIIHYACRLASAAAGSIRSYLLLAAIIFCYPWYDYLFCITFGINYVWGMALVLPAACYLLSSQERAAAIASVSVLCFVAGWIHEGFGVPLSCGGIAVAILRYRRHTLSGAYLIKLITLGGGTLMICFSPVFWNRAETAVSNIYKFPLKELIMQIGPGVVIFIAYMLALMIVVCHRQWRERLSKNAGGNEVTFFLTVIILVSLAVMIKYYNGPRTGAGVVMFATIGIIRLCASPVIKIPTLAGNIFKTILTVAILLNLGSAAYAQKKLMKEYCEVVSLFNASPSGIIYYDLTYPKGDLTLFKTTVRQFHERIPKRQLAWYLDKDKRMVILPKALEGLDAATVKEASRKGFYLYGGYIVMDPAFDLDSPQISVNTSEDERVKTRFRSDPFTDKTGREWVFLMPHIQTLDEDLRITDVLPD